MKQRSRILIAGCGYVGSIAAQQLMDAGHTVFGVRRDLARLPGGVQPVAIDLLRDDFASLPPNLDAIVWALSPSRDADGYRAAYVEAPERLLDFLHQRGDPIQRAVLVGSTAVWDREDGADVDEQTAVNPANFRGQSILAGENVFAASPFASVSLRVAGIYGPERTSMLERVSAGLAPPPSRPVYGNRIWRDDLASAIAHVLQLPAPAPVYVVVDDEPADLRDVYAWLAERLGVTLPAAVEGFAGRGGSKRCRNALLRRSGWRPAVVDYRAGYELLLRAR